MIACCLPFLAQAQNDLQQTNYMFNELEFNPAYAGATGTFRATLLARKQWLAFPTSPCSQTLAVDGATKRFGSFGMVAVNDMLGYQHFIHAKALYSYSVRFTEKTVLTAGASGGMIYYSLDGGRFEAQDKVNPDPVLFDDVQTDLRPTFDVGLQFLHSNLSLGLSAQHVQRLLRSATVADHPQHLYVYGQYKWDWTDKLYGVPTLWVKYGSNILQTDVNMNVYFNKKFWVGGTYRIGESAAALAGIILGEQWYIGYSYDFPISDLTRYNYGNHEIFVSFRLKPAAAQSGFYQSTRLFN
jgi:type IX secretion system PorP/SprF family membrane protein